MNHDPDLTVFLIRHARTALNAENRLRGLADPELDEVGLAEAHLSAAALRAEDLDYLVSGPLRRARTTAQIIADACEVPRGVDPGFTDRDYGPWTGRPRAEVLALHGSVDRAPGVEPVSTVLARAMGALDALTGRHVGYRRIGVVSHDATLRAVLEILSPGVRATVPTASWAVLRYVDGLWRVLSVDNVAARRSPG